MIETKTTPTPTPTPSAREGGQPRATRALLARAPLALCALCASLLLAACGSGGSSTITVGNENKADNALIKSTETSSKSEKSAVTEKKVTTPTSGPLSKEPTVTPPSGPAPTKLEIKELIKGHGAEAKDGEELIVNYVGVLYHSGKVFDASWKRKETFKFTLGEGQVIKGWDEGLVGMKVGGRRELVIPANLAYGSRGSGSTIPPNEPLVFVIDLLSN